MPQRNSVFSAKKCMRFEGKTAKLAGEIITNSRAKFPPSARHCFSAQDPGHIYTTVQPDQVRLTLAFFCDPKLTTNRYPDATFSFLCPFLEHRFG
jgi:hypothetical protein